MSSVQVEMVSTHLDEEVEFKETSRVEIKKKICGHQPGDWMTFPREGISVGNNF